MCLFLSINVTKNVSYWKRFNDNVQRTPGITKLFSNSFFLHEVKEWNNMNMEIRISKRLTISETLYSDLSEIL